MKEHTIPVFFYKDKHDLVNPHVSGQELKDLFVVGEGRDLYLLEGDKDIKIISIN